MDLSSSRHTCYDLLRRERADPRPRSTPRPPRAAPIPRPRRTPTIRSAWLSSAVARLKPRHRAVFLLFAVEGFSHNEIGRILGIPEGTSKTFLFEAKKKLQRWLKPQARVERSVAS